MPRAKPNILFEFRFIELISACLGFCIFNTTYFSCRTLYHCKCARMRRESELVFYFIFFFVVVFVVTSYFWNCLQHILICFQFYVGLNGWTEWEIEWKNERKKRSNNNTLPQSRSVYLVSLPAILIWKWRTRCKKTKQITSWFIFCSSKWKGISGKCSSYTISTQQELFLSWGPELSNTAATDAVDVFFSPNTIVHFKWMYI